MNNGIQSKNCRSWICRVPFGHKACPNHKPVAHFPCFLALPRFPLRKLLSLIAMASNLIAMASKSNAFVQHTENHASSLLIRPLGLIVTGISLLVTLSSKVRMPWSGPVVRWSGAVVPEVWRGTSPSIDALGIQLYLRFGTTGQRHLQCLLLHRIFEKV